MAVNLVWAQLASRGAEAIGATLGWCYLTDQLAPQAEKVLHALRERMPHVAWVGASGVGVLATGVEYFDEPALAVMLCALPADQYRVFSGVAPLGDVPPSKDLGADLIKLMGSADLASRRWIWEQYDSQVGADTLQKSGGDAAVVLEVLPIQGSAPQEKCMLVLFRDVADGALLVSIPDPVACFAEARYAQTITVDLAPTASLVLVDGFTAGRSARGERWELHRYTARTLVSRVGTPLLLESIVLDPAQGELPARLGRFDALATVALFGPRVAALREAALAAALPLARKAPLLAAVSPIGDDGALLRFAGSSVEEVSAAVRRCLAGLGALLGDDPFARKW